MDDFPLNGFLASLASDGIRLSVYDYDQLIVIFQTGGIRTCPRLLIVAPQAAGVADMMPKTTWKI